MDWAPPSSSPQGGELVPHTNDEPIGVTAGVFDASGLADVVSVQSGADRISLLDGTPGGGLADPSLATSYTTGIDPTQVVAAPLTGNGLTDLVVLNQGSDDISIFLNNGTEGFITMPRVDAGNDPTGLAVSDVNGNGRPDLLVSNAQGDLLIILGNGDGTFQPYERADQSVSLALGDFGSDWPDRIRPEQHIDRPALDPVWRDPELRPGTEPGHPGPRSGRGGRPDGDGN